MDNIIKNIPSLEVLKMKGYKNMVLEILQQKAEKSRQAEFSKSYDQAKEFIAQHGENADFDTILKVMRLLWLQRITDIIDCLENTIRLKD